MEQKRQTYALEERLGDEEVGPSQHLGLAIGRALTAQLLLFQRLPETRARTTQYLRTDTLPAHLLILTKRTYVCVRLAQDTRAWGGGPGAQETNLKRFLGGCSGNPAQPPTSNSDDEFLAHLLLLQL